MAGAHELEKKLTKTDVGHKLVVPGGGSMKCLHLKGAPLRSSSGYWTTRASIFCCAAPSEMAVTRSRCFRRRVGSSLSNTRGSKLVTRLFFVLR
ncbi:hypothetical protein Pyn_37131 [Prunus yedoensis var. nudiflora]|uniref:Uncharacterized protein n=1 Tax=Prunus yedoensis var. nudiflora TaxID=2094558 RepID=A0A314Y8J9_PRUYE|nr:hypothetical protein Pyn_37131 [Prunus yedoensis var. nudiflora]